MRVAVNAGPLEPYNLSPALEEGGGAGGEKDLFAKKGVCSSRGRIVCVSGCWQIWCSKSGWRVPSKQNGSFSRLEHSPEPHRHGGASPGARVTRDGIALGIAAAREPFHYNEVATPKRVQRKDSVSLTGG